MPPEHRPCPGVRSIPAGTLTHAVDRPSGSVSHRRPREAQRTSLWTVSDRGVGPDRSAQGALQTRVHAVRRRRAGVGAPLALHELLSQQSFVFSN